MVRRLVHIPLLLALLLCVAGVASASRVREVRLAQHDTFTRAVIELDVKSDYEIHNKSSDGGYLTIEMGNISAGPENVEATRKEKLVSASKIDFDEKSNVLKVHLQTPKSVRVEDFRLTDPERIVIDIHEVVARASLSGSGWKKRIVVDPGHGGKDPGAVGNLNGNLAREKDVVLAVSRDLRDLLNADPRFECAMIRDTDKYVALIDRPKMASLLKGDMFISIHANAVGGHAASRAKGFEIWTWNRDSNHSAAAKAVAKLENKEYSVNSENLPILTQMMEDILESQALVSRRLAHTVHQSFMKDSYFRSNDRGIDKARFKVLENYDMPSILIELGFMTHPDEVKLLTSRRFQRKQARYIYEGIIRYYAETDPDFPRALDSREVAGSGK